MYLDFCTYNRTSNKSLDSQLEDIFLAIRLGFNNISVPIRTLRELKPFLKETNITAASPVDYPFGNSEKMPRFHQTVRALKAGTSTIDLVGNNYFLHNKSYGKFSEEIKEHLKICLDHDAELRIVLDNSKYEPSEIIAISKVLGESGIEYVIPSTGFYRDDIYDNIITSMSIESKTSVKSIVSGHMWLEKHHKMAIEGLFFGLRAYSLELFV